MGNMFAFDEEQNKSELRRYTSPEPDFFALVDDQGGGELVELAKQALISSDTKLLDKTIKEKVVKFLYNEGRGDYIDIEELIKARMYSRDGYLKQYLQENEDKEEQDEFKKKSVYTKYVCFDIDKRGKYGETLLVQCLRNCTTAHNLIAKRMIHWFPQMVNDYSLSEEFYGESPLHVAAANEDPDMVRLLLTKRVNLHGRCFGTCFSPEDQKKRKDTLDSEFPILPEDTSYEGFTYYGEYPLSFAASVSSEECVRLMFAKKVDPNKKDLNGNTPLHMMVIQNNLKMFELLLELGADINLKNNKGLTPLALAAKLARFEIYEHILEETRDVKWKYADVTCVAYPLRNLDSIDENGKTDFTSPLMVLTYSNKIEHLEMFNGVILELLTQKWDHYIKFKFYIEFFVFLLFLGVCGITVIMKRLYFADLVQIGCIETSDMFKNLRPECKCAYLYPNDSNRNFRIFLEIVVILFTVLYLVIFATELLAQKLLISFKTLLANPSKLMFIIALFANLLIIPMRFTCNYHIEDMLVVISIVIMPFYIIYLARGFKRTSLTALTFVIGMQDSLITWSIIAGIIFIGFCQSLLLSIGYANQPSYQQFQSPLMAFLSCLYFSQHDYITTKDFPDAPYPVVGKALFFINRVLCDVIMSNLLIALFSDICIEISERDREWFRQWALSILCIEQTMKPEERLKQQRKYLQYMDNGDKSIISRWRESEEDREDNKKEEFVSMRERLRAVPGNPDKDFVYKN